MNRMIGDWNCLACQHLNFSRRDSCQRCGYPKSIGGDADNAIFGGIHDGSSFPYTNPDVKPGDWYCQCGYHNFASRFTCFKCNATKNVESVVSINGSCAGRSWKSGDWLCTRSGCNWHNFASRIECYRCNAPRYSGTEA